MLQDLPAEIADLIDSPGDRVSYWYEGRDPIVGNSQRLPRTAAAEALGHYLNHQLTAELGPAADRGGKMYGVLIVENSKGERGWLKAFSGLLDGSGERSGWVPPIPGRDRVALLEAQTLDQLEALKWELIALKSLPQRQEYDALSRDFAAQLAEMGDRHRENKLQRKAQRQALLASCPPPFAKGDRGGFQLGPEQNPPCPPLRKGGMEAGEGQREIGSLEAGKGCLKVGGEQNNVEAGLEGRDAAEIPKQKEDATPPPFSKGDRGGFQALEELSRRDKRERRALKQERVQALEPLKAAIAQTDTQILHIKRQRKALSQQLQAEMHRAYSLQNFSGEAVSLTDLGLGALPTGTGECCAPKLLHYAASQQLKPLALAEFWSAAAAGDRQPGQFYGACEERCQPLLGFLLGGLEQRILGQPIQPIQPGHPTPIDLSLPILYEDDWLIALDKPPGLLSVPGRSRHRQDSVLSRLRHQLRDRHGALLGDRLQVCHRLDQDTSGILLLAKDPASHRSLQRQFEQRQVHKTYEALLQGSLKLKDGQITLPLAPDPQRPPRQHVDPEGGKPSLTRFILLDHRRGLSRVRFEPVTGRSHQLRVHAAVGLGMPILGDRLYGFGDSGRETSAERRTGNLGDRPADIHQNRLHLHAQRLSFSHVLTRQPIQLQSQVPF